MGDKRIIRYAAHHALEAHDALCAANAAEPPSGENGMPLEPATWVEWLDSRQKPAYARWSSAMDTLDAVLGESLSRHPAYFRPRCRAILEETATREP